MKILCVETGEFDVIAVGVGGRRLYHRIGQAALDFLLTCSDTFAVQRNGTAARNLEIFGAVRFGSLGRCGGG